MTDTEILAKYGTIELEFVKSYKNKWTYQSTDGKYKVTGDGADRCEFTKTMTVADLWQELVILNFTQL